MKVAPEKPDKQAVFNAALAEVSGEPAAEATTPRKRAAKAAAAPAEATAAEPAKAAEPAAPAEDAAPAAAADQPAES
jgi:small subunit ribosomal protein S16